MTQPHSHPNYITWIVLLLFSSSLVSQEAQPSDQQAPDFQMTLIDGSQQYLSAYRGQVVYISFWASWCSPCLTNFKKYKDIRQKLSDMGIILLNVSIDQDLTNWKNALEINDIKGVHAHVPKSHLYPGYEISSIPLYDIIGKDGAFKYLSDEAGRDILAQFEAFKEELIKQ